MIPTPPKWPGKLLEWLSLDGPPLACPFTDRKCPFPGIFYIPKYGKTASGSYKRCFCNGRAFVIQK